METWKIWSELLGLGTKMMEKEGNSFLGFLSQFVERKRGYGYVFK